MHALIVAGPSGAGKTTLLRELYAGRLASEVRRHLPPEADTWPLVHCNYPDQWQRFVSGEDAVSRTPGVVAHHDITLSWRKHRHEPARDPFWQILHRCDRVTLVVVQPSPRRLLAQWSRAHLGMHPWKVQARKLLGVSAWRILRGIRRLRRSRHAGESSRMRYPRPIRFLKHVDRKLKSLGTRPIVNFEFYRRSANIEQMLTCWSDMIEAKMAALPVNRIEIVPVSGVATGTVPNWRVRSLRWMREPSAALRAPVPA